MQTQEAFEGFDVSIDSKAKLEAKFIVPPFSVMDTRQGYWQERKRLWLSLGLQSELGRGQIGGVNGSTVASNRAMDLASGFSERLREESREEHPLKGAKAYKSQKALDKIMHSGALHKGSTGIEWGDEYGGGDTWRGSGTSIFDPVLCELIYKWFCPNGGHILDPFAGGSVRGIVASVLDHSYTGLDLSLAQIEANREQAGQIVPAKQPEWIIGDSWVCDLLLPRGKHYDLVFSCPPYHDLEKYTDDPGDLSNMSWDMFKLRYKAIIEKCILRLNNNRFACFVVSEIRDDNGAYKGLVPYTIECFVRGGARYYNEMILVNVVGSLPIRIAGQFANRKIGRTHQNVLVFYKGDVDLIPKFFKDIDTSFNYGGNTDDPPQEG